MMRSSMFAGVLAMVGAAWGAEGNMIGPMTQNEGFFAVPAKNQVVIDGKLDEWDLSGEIWSFGDYEVREQFSVKTAAMWDKDNLYLSFYWKDPLPLNSTVDPDFIPDLGWRADAVQCRIKIGEQVAWVTSWCYENRPCLLLEHWTRPDGDVDMKQKLYKGEVGKSVLGDGIESAYVKLDTNDGFIHEMKIPLSRLANREYQAKAGEKILMGLEFKWGDVSGQATPTYQFTDNMSIGNTSRQFFWKATKSWGDLTFSNSSVKEKRRYVYQVEKLQGTVPVRAEIPADVKTFTLVIEDAKGKRIRNLAGGFNAEAYRIGDVKNGKQTVEVMWDCLDDFGKLAPAGNYAVRGLTHKGLSAKYVMSYYNPGTPAWAMPDGKGAWGSDHTPTRFAARSGENMILSAGFVEGGYGVWALGPDGKKIWSDPRGLIRMAANDKYVFTIPNHWYTKDTVLYRYDAKTGKVLPFVFKGETREVELPITKLMGVEKLEEISTNRRDKVIAMTAGPNSILLGLAKGMAVELDAESGEKIAMHRLDYDYVDIKEEKLFFTPMAMDEKYIYYFRNNELIAYEKKIHRPRPVRTDIAIEKPVSIAIGPDGNLYIADRGYDMNVKKFTPSGKFLGTYGKRGGRARAGEFEQDGMLDMSSVAVDIATNVWTVEYTQCPRRVSVWKNDGTFLRDYIGNTGYAAACSYLHDSDVGRGFVGPNEVALDMTNGTYRMKHVIANPKKDGTAFSIDMDWHTPHVFYSSASGEKREYLFASGTTKAVLYMKEGRSWKPVSAIAWICGLQDLDMGMYFKVNKQPFGEFEGENPYSRIIWNDCNGDGLVQRKECEIIPPPADNFRDTLLWYMGWGQRMDPEDLSFYITVAHEKGTRYRVKPKSFARNGAPRYSYSTFEKFAEVWGAEASDTVPVPGDDKVITFSEINRKGVLIGFDKKGNQLWTYPSPYTSVHGSHRAIMPKPGLLIGPTRIAGVVPKCGDAKGVFMMRGNLGQDFYMTTDGLYVDAMFRDCRFPVAPFPSNEEALKTTPFNLYCVGGEPFGGWIGRQDDGVVRMLCAVPAREAASIVNIEGLESIRYYKAPSFALSEATRVKADSDNIARAKESTDAKPYVITRVEKNPGEWREWAKIPAMNVNMPGMQENMQCRLAYDNTQLYAHFIIRGDESPWMNAGTDKTRMFKSGDCVDLCLSPSANTSMGAKDGDLRVVMSAYGTNNVAMLMRKVYAKAARKERVRYESPVRGFDMAQVKEVAEPKVTKDAKQTTIEIVLPWSELGVQAKSGLKMRGDVGMILSDSAGRMNVARVYYANKNTNLVNDLPGEADIYPHLWIEFELK